MYPTNDLEMIGAMRRPIQCEGLDRGPKRVSEVAISGSMNPQIDWGGIIGTAAQALPGILGSFGI